LPGLGAQHLGDGFYVLRGRIGAKSFRGIENPGHMACRWNRPILPALTTRWSKGRGRGVLRLNATQPGEIEMIVSALITFLVVILILYLINMLPIDGRAKQIARIVVIILGVISLLKYIAVF
jgi:hypothetical protein